MPTRRQLALIHLAKSALRLSDDLYRDILYVQAGVESAKDLTREGFERVLQRFRELGFRHIRDERPGAEATRGQLKMMRHLFDDLGWFDRARREGFCRRMCGEPEPRTREQANKVIEALKAMVRRGYGERVKRTR
jgi:hypothetical protein